jgi:hypothetical protein
LWNPKKPKQRRAAANLKRMKNVFDALCNAFERVEDAKEREV